MGKQDKKK